MEKSKSLSGTQIKRTTETQPSLKIFDFFVESHFRKALKVPNFCLHKRVTYSMVANFKLSQCLTFIFLPSCSIDENSGHCTSAFLERLIIELFLRLFSKKLHILIYVCFAKSSGLFSMNSYVKPGN